MSKAATVYVVAGYSEGEPKVYGVYRKRADADAAVRAYMWRVVIESRLS